MMVVIPDAALPECWVPEYIYQFITLLFYCLWVLYIFDLGLVVFLLVITALL